MVRNPLAARWLFTAMVGVALGFGAQQAVAAPTVTNERAQMVCDTPKCNPQLCDRFCRLIGAFSGQCTPSGGCACAL